MTIRKITQEDVDLVNEITHTKVKGKSVNFDDVPEERMLTKQQYDDVWFDHPDISPLWGSLPLAPKHTDEQFDAMVKQWEDAQIEVVTENRELKNQIEDELRQRQLTEAALMTERNNVSELKAQLKMRAGTVEQQESEIQSLRAELEQMKEKMKKEDTK